MTLTSYITRQAWMERFHNNRVQLKEVHCHQESIFMLQQSFGAISKFTENKRGPWHSAERSHWSIIAVSYKESS